MGKLILCTSKAAEKPYKFQASGILVYSIEELCYYIYNNIYEIGKESFNEEMILWLKTQAHLPKLADKLVNLKKENCGVRDLVVTVLCSCDYYTETEIRNLVQIMGELEQLSGNGRKKKQVDTFLSHGNYVSAKEGYDAILSDSLAFPLTPVERGDILHNRSIACFYLGAYKEAGAGFKKAYGYNKNEESLRHYMLSLLINNDRTTFDMEADNFHLSREYTKNLVEEMTEAYLLANDEPELKEAEKYRRYYDEKQAMEYADKMIETWKEQIRYGYI